MEPDATDLPLRMPDGRRIGRKIGRRREATDTPVPPMTRQEMIDQLTAAKITAKRRQAIAAVIALLVGTLSLASGVVGVTGDPWWFAVILGAVVIVAGVLVGLGS